MSVFSIQFNIPGSVFMKSAQPVSWIKEQHKITILFAILTRQLHNFVLPLVKNVFGDKQSVLDGSWSMDQADPDGWKGAGSTRHITVK